MDGSARYWSRQDTGAASHTRRRRRAIAAAAAIAMVSVALGYSVAQLCLPCNEYASSRSPVARRRTPVEEYTWMMEKLHQHYETSLHTAYLTNRYYFDLSKWTKVRSTFSASRCSWPELAFWLICLRLLVYPPMLSHKGTLGFPLKRVYIASR
eukprot:scaffold395493_cov43-Prasinocladus_malaysianus.AAC.1